MGFSLRNTSLTHRQAVPFYTMELLSRAELIRLTENWFVNGIETQSICLLAGEMDPFSSDAYPLFEKAMIELGIEIPDRPVAAIEVLHDYLTLIVTGLIDAYEGMGLIDENVCGNNFFPDKVYVGDGLGFEKVFTWYRELQDAADGSRLIYYTDHSLDEAIQLFKQHIVDETRVVFSSFLDLHQKIESGVSHPEPLLDGDPVPKSGNRSLGYIKVIPFYDLPRMD